MDLSFEVFSQKKLPNISMKLINTIIDLINKNMSVPFLTYYRKEKIENLSEQDIYNIIEVKEEFENLSNKKNSLIKEIESQGNLTNEVKENIDNCWKVNELEEIFRPFKRKKKTKATIARESGLEPLANWIWDKGHNNVTNLSNNKEDISLEIKAKDYLSPSKGFITYELVLNGAQSILVEKIANNSELRNYVRKDYFTKGKLLAKKGKKFKDNSKYSSYFDFSDYISKLSEPKASHRYLALRRGWNEGELTILVQGSESDIIQKFTEYACSNKENNCLEFLKKCAIHAFLNHVHPSISNEVLQELKQKADLHAVEVGVENFKQILLSPPFGNKFVLGIYTNIKNQCNLALIDKESNFISHIKININTDNIEDEFYNLIAETIKKIPIKGVAILNSIQGRRTEIILRKVLKRLTKDDITIALVKDNNINNYVNSESAKNEFPTLDNDVKTAIFIARKFIDPLQELVKVDLKHVGVGQYQHDINQNLLQKFLKRAIYSCVNLVGVNLNTANSSLLSYVSGIDNQLAENIVSYRKEKGKFKDLNDLLKIPSFNSHIFEQSSGFLRIFDGSLSFDATKIHPERYSALKDMAKDLNISINDLFIEDNINKILENREKWIQLLGDYTFRNIINELRNYKKDIRGEFKTFAYRDDVFLLSDLKEDMVCSGLVTNVTNFGAFIDIGINQDGLVHISELSDKFVKDTKKLLKPGDQVKVKVKKVDLDKKQLSLTMKIDLKPQRSQKKSDEKYNKDDRSNRRESMRFDRNFNNNRDNQGGQASRGDRRDQEKQGYQGNQEHQGKSNFFNDKQSNKSKQKKFDRSYKGSFDKNKFSKESANKRRKESKPFNNPFAALSDLKK